jgi:hypothetical protein
VLGPDPRQSPAECSGLHPDPPIGIGAAEDLDPRARSELILRTAKIANHMMITQQIGEDNMLGSSDICLSPAHL